MFDQTLPTRGKPSVSLGNFCLASIDLVNRTTRMISDVSPFDTFCHLFFTKKKVIFIT